MDIPKSVGRYHIVDEIGRGGMGRVLRAHDPQLDRWVAVKIIQPHLEAGPSSDEMKIRFLREARLAARLHHPGIVTVFDAGTEGDLLWLVMELVQGESLSHRLTHGPSPDRKESLEIVAKVADALGAAHAAGIIHRDIKPANILLLPDGTPKVTDFGVARAVGDNTALTRTGASVGSPSYMAPEQIRGEPVDPRADLFSLGVVAYQLLLKRRPFPADTITTLVYQILNHDPFSDGQALDRLGSEIVAFLRRALAKERENRFENSQAMATAARSLTTDGTPPRLPPIESDPTFIQPSRMTDSGVQPGSRAVAWVLAGIAGTILTAATVLGLWAFFNLPRKSSEPPTPQVLMTPTRAKTTEGMEPPETPTPAQIIEPPQNTSTPRPPIPTPAEDIRPRKVRVSPTTIPFRPTAIPTAITVHTRPRPTPIWARPTPVPRPTSPHPSVPPPAPAPTPNPTPTVAPTPTSPPISDIFACRRGAEFGVDPEDALITINGTVLGIADDWDDTGGGQIYYFPAPGRYLVKLSHPEYATAWIRISVSQYAEDDVVEVDTELEELN